MPYPFLLPLMMSYLPLPLLIAAAVFDYRTRRIPNQLTYSLAAAGLVAQVLAGGLTGFGEALGGLGLTLLIFLILPGLRVGGGDCKLAGGIGAWIGIDRVLLFVLYTLAAVLITAIAATWMREGIKGVGGRVLAEVKTFGVVSSPLAAIPAAPLLCLAYFFVILGR